MTTIFNLDEATPSVVTSDDAVEVPEAPRSVAKQQGSCPPSLHEAGGDEAARSPFASVKPVWVEKEALSSQKDDSLLGKTPCGDGLKVLGELPINLQILQWHTLGR